MEATEGCHVEWNESDLERHILHVLPYVCELKCEKGEKNKKARVSVQLQI